MAEKIRIDWMDANLINFLYYEDRMYREVVDDDNRDGFTEDFHNKVKNLIYDIADSRRCDFYINNSFKKSGGM